MWKREWKWKTKLGGDRDAYHNVKVAEPESGASGGERQGMG